MLRCPIFLFRIPVGLSLMGICLVALIGRYLGGADSDTLWHLLAGNYMLEYHTILKRDIFSWTMLGKPWFPAEWLYEVVIAGVNSKFGVPGLLVLHLLASALQMGLIYRMGKRAGAPAWWCGLLAGVLTYSMLPYITFRPQVFSYLLFTWMLSILDRRSTGAKTVYQLPVLSFIWVNFHLSYILLILWVGFEWVIGFVRLRLARLQNDRMPGQLHLLLAWILSIAASLLNPETYHVYPYVFQMSSNNDMKNNIIEYLSPNFHNDSLLYGFLLPAAAIWLILIATTRRFQLRHALYIIGTFSMSLVSVRYYPYFLICSSFALVKAGPELIGYLRLHLRRIADQAAENMGFLPMRIRRLFAAITARLKWSWVLNGLFLVLFLFVIVAQVPNELQKANWPRMEQDYPAQAVQYLKDHKLTDRVLNAYQWGGFFEMNGILGYVDGRTDLFLMTNVFMDYIRFSTLHPDTDAILKSYDVRVICMPSGSNVTTYLNHSPFFKQVYSDRIATIYVRNANPW